MTQTACLRIKRKLPCTLLHALCLSAGLILFSGQVAAQTPYGRPGMILPEEMNDKLDRTISLDLRDIHVIDVLKFLSTKAELNIVASQNINARVTLFLKEVSIGSALDIILISTGLAVRVKQGILYVMTEEEYVALYGESYRDQRVLSVLEIQYTSATKVSEILGGMKSAIGKIITDAQTGTIVLIDTAEKVKIMEAMAQKIDIPTVERILPTKTEVFELSYGSAEDVQTQILPYLTENVGTVQVDARTNRLVVTDFQHAIDKVRNVVQAFDRKTRQVFITAKILQVRLNNEYQMGIDWQKIFNEGAGNDFPEININGNFGLSTVPTNFGRLILGDLGENDATATIDFLHIFGDTKTLASPQIAVENNEEATILVGTREAFVTSTISQADSTTTTSESITFIDVGVQLVVKPTINKDDFISLRITPEVSAVGRTLTTSNGNQIPIVDTTNADTKVLVKDGHTILIGGLMKDEVSKTVRKLPIFGDIPIIGSAFRFNDDNNTKTELVIFLTPYIVGGDEDYPISPVNSGKPMAQFRGFEE